MAGDPKKFIQGAIKRPGALTRKAKSAGMSINAFARKVVKPGSKTDSLTKRQATLFLKVLKPASKKKRGK